MNTTIIKIRVELNGTSENPWHKMGLTQNPIPQLAKYELDRACLIVQKLGGDPIPNTDYIRETLKGFSPEFTELCCAKFVPGETVKFEVYWED